MNKAQWLLLAFVPGLAAAAEYPATIEWSQRVELGVPVSGTVSKVAANPGERVSAGALLLELDEVPFRARVDGAEAAVARTREESRIAADDLKRAEELFAREVLATVEVDKARAAAREAAARLREAQAQAELSRHELARSKVHAPFDAWVIARAAQPGQSIVAGLQAPVLVVVARAGEYLARTRVPAQVAQQLAAGVAAEVVVGDTRYTGTVSGIGLEPVAGVDPPQYAVDVRFSEPARVLRAGSPAQIRLP